MQRVSSWIQEVLHRPNERLVWGEEMLNEAGMLTPPVSGHVKLHMTAGNFQPVKAVGFAGGLYRKFGYFGLEFNREIC